MLLLALKEKNVHSIIFVVTHTQKSNKLNPKHSTFSNAIKISNESGNVQQEENPTANVTHFLGWGDKGIKLIKTSKSC